MADGTAPDLRARLVPPLLGDIIRLSREMREDERAQWCALNGFDEYDPEVAAQSIIATLSPVSFALVDGQGFPIVVGGFDEVRRGVWQSWMIGTDAGWAKHWRAITRASRSSMDTLLASDRAHRIQTHALASRAAAHGWYRRGLGMTFEGTQRRYFANGEDAVCYVRIKEAD